MNRVIEIGERWIQKDELCSYLGCGRRFIEERISEGMPHALIAGRSKFRLSEVERWLEDRGHFERRGHA